MLKYIFVYIMPDETTTNERDAEGRGEERGKERAREQQQERAAKTERIRNMKK